MDGGRRGLLRAVGSEGGFTIRTRDQLSVRYFRGGYCAGMFDRGTVGVNGGFC